MSEVHWAPNQVERRAFRSNESCTSNSNTTLNRIPTLSQARSSMRISEPLKQIYIREQVVQLLNEQMELSIRKSYPLCFVLAEFKLPHDTTDAPDTEVLFAVARLFNLVLRPTDIVIRYRGMVACILHEANEEGGHRAAARVAYHLDQGVQVAHKRIQPIPSFGFSVKLANDNRPAERLLINAENGLWAHRAP